MLSLSMLITALAVRLAMKPPVLMRQERAGYRGEPFELMKLRTLTAAAGAQVHPLPDEVRLTRSERGQ